VSGGAGATGASDPLPGRRLADRYRIIELIAGGGMARVYRARDERLERHVAVKVLSSPYAEDPEFASRFLGEARAAASLSHPSLVHVYDSGSDGDAHYIVMELLEGHRTLRQELDARGPLSRDEVLRIGQELLAGLRVVHEHDLVHCDVKAGNVMLGPGPAKLIDFGIARSPRVGVAGDLSIGSLSYMSPEQLHGEGLTPASDLFSLGAVLYEALTGRIPYPGRTPEEVSAAHAAGGVRPPSTLVEGVSGRLDEAILQALRREPEQRFRSAAAMTRALDAAEDAVVAARDDDTRVIPATSSAGPPEGAGPVPPPAPGSGYVPPPAPTPQPTPVRRSAGGRHVRPRAGIGAWSLVGTLVVMATAGLVVVLVVLPLLELGSGSGPTPSASPSPVPSVPVDVIPSTIGLATEEAIALASAAGLDWTVRCSQDPNLPEGIVDQEPPAGTPVAPGAPFTMYSARISDCR
jgi:eukaryotic-like serine/threonine-protein kinase